METEDNLEQNAVKHGRDAWERIKSDQTFEDWLLVGQALDIGRAWARQRSNATSGRGYNETFSDWLNENGFGDSALDKGTRSRLADIMEHRAEVEAWRAKLPLKERLRKNHPNTIWRGWETYKKGEGLHEPGEVEEAAQEPRKRRGGAAAEIDAATTRLHEAADQIENRLHPDLIQMLDFEDPERIEECARIFVEVWAHVPTANLRRFAEALLRLLDGGPAEPGGKLDPAFERSLQGARRGRRARAAAPSADAS